ncbi:DUF2254 domain-containing protein [Massilia sp. CCM 9210]|uniref:DUF2254 domain-containing protein n=1 Tax=Massilia scottii TaxID=3057166 RepID=UPI00279661A8|nr:DUF2254 domain-containing protein [Massilia sp. CCM 9210]MDQ1812038.1 DUF2254 domain-containing protein [Massilia sp. CCM 9210]
MQRIKWIWTTLRASFWFLPYLIVSAYIGAAVVLTHLRPGTSDLWLSAFPQLFSVSAAGARDMLSTIAASMISVVGIVFSMTLVALALASSQYSSRVLRTFMRSRLTQASIGVFAGLYAYCLIVLRGVKGQDDELVVPVTAVTLGVVGAVAAVGLLIFFIHHIAVSIQASTILASIAGDTIATIEHMFPKQDDDSTKRERDEAEAAARPAACVQSVPATISGYVQSIDEAALVAYACKHDTMLRMELGVGQFVVAGACLVTVEQAQCLAPRTLQALRDTVRISAYRTVEQDPAFGVRQIVDVALRALSPGINDTTTAVMSIDYLGTILAALAPRAFQSPYRRAGGSLRLVTVQPNFAAMVHEAFDQIRRGANGNVSIILRMTEMIHVVGKLLSLPDRARAMSEQLDFLDELNARTVEAELDRSAIGRRIGQVRSALANGRQAAAGCGGV